MIYQKMGRLYALTGRRGEMNRNEEIFQFDGELEAVY